jgi:hypothetical protein
VLDDWYFQVCHVLHSLLTREKCTLMLSAIHLQNIVFLLPPIKGDVFGHKWLEDLSLPDVGEKLTQASSNSFAYILNIMLYMNLHSLESQFNCGDDLVK